MDYELIMVEGNSALRRLSNKLLGPQQYMTFRRIMFGKTDGIDPALVRKIRGLPELHVIQQVRDIHDEVFRLYENLRQKLVWKAYKRCRRIPRDQYVVEAEYTTSNAIFNYCDADVRFTTYLYGAISKELHRFPAKWFRQCEILQSEMEDFDMAESVSVDHGYDIDMVRSCCERADLSEFEREVFAAAVNDTALAHVAYRHNKTRMAATLALRTAREKIQKTIRHHDAMRIGG